MAAPMAIVRLSYDNSSTISTSPNRTITLAEETVFFNSIYDQISDAFDQWEAQLHAKGRKLSDLEQSDRYIDLPILLEKDVLMGKRPDDKGFWTRGFRL